MKKVYLAEKLRCFVEMNSGEEQEEVLAPAFQIAADVTEEEFRKARLQARLTWILTFGSSMLAVFLWISGFRLLGFLPQGILAGIGAYAAFYAILSEGRKMNTMRLRKYQELRRLRQAKGKAKALIEAQKQKE